MPSFITPQTIKPLLNIEEGDTTKDALFLEWIRQASAYMETILCRQPIAETTQTNFIFDGTGTEDWTFPYRPVSAVTLLEERVGYGGSGSWDTVSSSDYELLTRKAGTATVSTLHFVGGFADGVANYRVTFTHGYASSALPQAVTQVCCEIVQQLYKQWEGGVGKEASLGLSSISGSGSTGGLSVSKSFTDLTPRWEDLLAPYSVIPL